MIIFILFSLISTSSVVILKSKVLFNYKSADTYYIVVTITKASKLIVWKRLLERMDMDLRWLSAGRCFISGPSWEESDFRVNVSTVCVGCEKER